MKTPGVASLPFFRDDVNRILARSGLAYELRPNGLIARIPPEVLCRSMQTATFRTGDADLDAVSEAAQTKFLHPDFTVRREALEKLWDAWERLKTIEPGTAKPPQSRNSSTELQMNRASDSSLRTRRSLLRVLATNSRFATSR